MGMGSQKEGSKTNRTFSGPLWFQQRQVAYIYTRSIGPRNIISSSGLVGRNGKGWRWKKAGRGPWKQWAERRLKGQGFYGCQSTKDSGGQSLRTSKRRKGVRDEMKISGKWPSTGFRNNRKFRGTEGCRRWKDRRLRPGEPSV